ncbi:MULTISPECIES: hypothetical protein [Actinomyces]|uniref:Uncharacterized protein n=1 Tax=Actinomyces respiraculi TaxID=2744574 RepID=A0A7T0LKL5_9ACTO|nr:MULTISPECIES: hypothetical protein [Actinomyces]QPL05491.1 hypothetical protein ID810_00335 [Actinomyces respiraculi]
MTQRTSRSWSVYQKMVAAYRHRDRIQGTTLMQELLTNTSWACHRH